MCIFTTKSNNAKYRSTPPKNNSPYKGLWKSRRDKIDLNNIEEHFLVVMKPVCVVCICLLSLLCFIVSDCLQNNKETLSYCAGREPQTIGIFASLMTFAALLTFVSACTISEIYHSNYMKYATSKTHFERLDKVLIIISTIAAICTGVCPQTDETFTVISFSKYVQLHTYVHFVSIVTFLGTLVLLFIRMRSKGVWRCMFENGGSRIVNLLYIAVIGPIIPVMCGVIGIMCRMDFDNVITCICAGEVIGFYTVLISVTVFSFSQ